MSGDKPRVEIIPMGIALLNETNFPCTIPTLYLLLAGDGIINIGVHLEPYPVSLGEALKQIVLVLMHAFRKVAGHTCVQCPVTFAGEDVDITIAHFLNASRSQIV